MAILGGSTPPQALGVRCSTDMTDFEDSISEEEKDDLEQAAIDNERSKTTYGSQLPDDYRDDS